MKKDIKSFTLIELIIVVVILGILAAIAIPNYTNTVEQRKGEACMINMRIIIAAERIYNLRNGEYWPEPTHTNFDLDQINASLRINISDPNFTYDVCNANYTEDPLIRIIGVRKSGPFGNPDNPLDDRFGIVCEYHIKTDNIIWGGGWFAGIVDDPPSFPLPEQ